MNEWLYDNYLLHSKIKHNIKPIKHHKTHINITSQKKRYECDDYKTLKRFYIQQNAHRLLRPRGGRPRVCVAGIIFSALFCTIWLFDELFFFVAVHQIVQSSIASLLSFLCCCSYFTSLHFSQKQLCDGFLCNIYMVSHIPT